MNYVYLAIAFVVGIAITIQAGVNASLRQAMNNPVLAAAISFGSGFLVLTLLFLATGGVLPAAAAIRQVSWWKWIGGLIGAVYVTSVIVSVPKIGTANLISLSVAGQLLAALILDHYGLLGVAVHPVNGWRLFGIMLIITGVLVVVKN